MAATVLLLLACTGCNDGKSEVARKPDGFKQIEFPAKDGHKVYADFYPSDTPNSEKVVLMFHQANSNSTEYEGIALTIISLGYNCIVLDQRAGGDMWGKDNRTVSKSGSGSTMDAYSDLLGALDYAHSLNYTSIIAWGSSYSASLAFKLASENPEIKAVLAFSPGEYFDDKSIVKSWASKVTVPVLFACTKDELADDRQDLYNAIPSDSKVLASFDGGVHGSSTLLPEKSKAAGEYMDKVKSFFNDLKSN